MVNNRRPGASPSPSRSDDPVDSPNEYEVGRGRPPVHSRFRPGGKGGPGRPKGSKNRATLFAEAMDSQRPVTVEGRKKRMSAQELGYRQLAMRVAKGDLKALSLAEQIRNNLCGPEEGTPAFVPPLTEAELAILERLGGE